MSELLRTELSENGRKRTYRVLLIHEFGNFSSELDTRQKIANKVSDLWVESKEFDVLFSDFTRGDPEAFMDVFFDPLSVWLEVERVDDGRTIGVARLNWVLPKIDAEGHLAFWDAKAKDREPLAWDMLAWAFDRYELRRFTIKAPAFQKGLIRFINRLGFVKEGVTRKARFHKNKWVDDVCFGLLKEELEEVRNAAD